jgi:hypothetical protein
MTAGTEGLEHADETSAIDIVGQKQNEALQQAMQQSPAAAAALEGVLQAQNAAINQAMQRASNHQPGPTPGLADRVEEGLQKLNQLKQAGVLSDAGYQAKRQQLLDQL